MKKQILKYILEHINQNKNASPFLDIDFIWKITAVLRGMIFWGAIFEISTQIFKYLKKKIS